MTEIKIIEKNLLKNLAASLLN